MSKIISPTDSNWNQYWSEEKTKQFTQISWSKKRIIEILNPLMVKNATALDAGCGSGFFSEYFLGQGMNVVALDYSDSALKIAQEKTKGRAQLVKADLVNSDLAKETNATFDLIFSDGLFEHFSLGDQDKIMRNLISVLKKNAVIVTFVPNRFSPWELIRPFYMPGIEEKPFIQSELRDLNVRNGLNISKQGGVNTFPFAFSPDQICGSSLGMLLYTVAQK